MHEAQAECGRRISAYTFVLGQSFSFFLFLIWIPEQGCTLRLNNTSDCSGMTNDSGTDGGKGQAGGPAGGG